MNSDQVCNNTSNSSTSCNEQTISSLCDHGQIHISSAQNQFSGERKLIVDDDQFQQYDESEAMCVVQPSEEKHEDNFSSCSSSYENLCQEYSHSSDKIKFSSPAKINLEEKLPLNEVLELLVYHLISETVNSAFKEISETDFIRNDDSEIQAYATEVEMCHEFRIQFHEIIATSESCLSKFIYWNTLAKDNLVDSTVPSEPSEPSHAVQLILNNENDHQKKLNKTECQSEQFDCNLVSIVSQKSTEPFLALVGDTNVMMITTKHSISNESFIIEEMQSTAETKDTSIENATSLKNTLLYSSVMTQCLQKPLTNESEGLLDDNKMQTTATIANINDQQQFIITHNASEQTNEQTLPITNSIKFVVDGTKDISTVNSVSSSFAEILLPGERSCTFVLQEGNQISREHSSYERLPQTMFSEHVAQLINYNHVGAFKNNENMFMTLPMCENNSDRINLDNITLENNVKKLYSVAISHEEIFETKQNDYKLGNHENNYKIPSDYKLKQTTSEEICLCINSEMSINTEQSNCCPTYVIPKSESYSVVNETTIFPGDMQSILDSEQIKSNEACPSIESDRFNTTQRKVMPNLHDVNYYKRDNLETCIDFPSLKQLCHHVLFNMRNWQTIGKTLYIHELTNSDENMCNQGFIKVGYSVLIDKNLQMDGSKAPEICDKHQISHKHFLEYMQSPPIHEAELSSNAKPNCSNVSSCLLTKHLLDVKQDDDRIFKTLKELDKSLDMFCNENGQFSGLNSEDGNAQLEPFTEPKQKSDALNPIADVFQKGSNEDSTKSTNSAQMSKFAYRFENSSIWTKKIESMNCLLISSLDNDSTSSIKVTFDEHEHLGKSMSSLFVDSTAKSKNNSTNIIETDQLHQISQALDNSRKFKKYTKLPKKHYKVSSKQLRVFQQQMINHNSNENEGLGQMDNINLSFDTWRLDVVTHVLYVFMIFLFFTAFNTVLSMTYETD